MTHDAKELTEALVDKLLQTIDPSEIADESLRQTIEILLNLVEQLNSEENTREPTVAGWKQPTQREQGKPDIKAKQPRGEKVISLPERTKTPKAMRKV